MRKVMKNTMLLAIVFFCACKNNRKAKLVEVMKQPYSGLVQQKQVGATIVNVTYLPLCWEQVNNKNAERNDDEICFKVNVHHLNEADLKKQSASYGVDTLFQLVLNRDTLAPIGAERIANGAQHDIEYLVIFERRSWAPVQQTTFIFKDWLFTSTRLLFPLDKKFLQKSDSLSCGL
ncbi:hypothetical protein SAMN05660909_01629 [Chitinophaga terrae (ex Kim and Jung 2007)]|uniref:Uncharacterized protein n=1 Tax=Chitinophaga terrae (ex Kim and Jung 2007) TaxID=408074 RepID=A0A1H4AKI4_9BACT|nr:hypothetical protein [Chitinophaga terrae (ex Kim and Jung 2007)]GEP89283.1 hypothetical protein CTE07_09280 [Chitinophaga terrae (ex Kim and Jung 2007)]SEA36307.1 hypothetical protein SAMN05660909_01629 [Chitinophaga terrae (ex Kim and Jung 2007)]